MNVECERWIDQRETSVEQRKNLSLRKRPPEHPPPGGGVLKKVSYGEAPTPYPFIYHFFRKDIPFTYLLLEKGTPFIYLLYKT